MEYYSHTIRITNFNMIDIEKVEEILKSGYLYSRRNLREKMHIDNENLSEKNTLFNGMDYISLCDLSKERSEYSAYRMYVNRGLSFLLNKKMEVIIPNVMYNIRAGYYSFFGDAHLFGLQKDRYSDLPDEVQVRDKISLDYLEGMSISLKTMQKFHDNRYIIDYLQLLKNILIKYEKNVPIINIDTEEEVLVDSVKAKN